MALNRLKDTALPHLVSSVITDLADLFQKEMRLARAEVAAKISTKLRAGVWMAVAGIMGIFAGLLVLQAAVFALANHGIALHWASLIVAAAVALVATIFFFKGRSDAMEELSPTRTINQVKRDIATAKEHMS
jgi:uncharacterized protein YacL